jgi:phospholipase D1/2
LKIVFDFNLVQWLASHSKLVALHTLRMRLMREHVGVDVDAMSEADLIASEPVKPDYEQKEWDPDAEQEHGQESGVTRVKKSQQRTPVSTVLHDVADGLEQGL